MKRKVKTIEMAVLALVFMFLGVRQLYAQGVMGEPQRPILPDSVHVVKMVDKMADELSLTDQQKTTLLKMNLEHFRKVRAIVKKDKTGHEATREKLETMRKQVEKQMASVLNDDQKEQFKHFLETHRPPKGKHPGCE